MPPPAPASPCSSPASWICTGRPSASPRSACWNRPAARWKCRARRPAAASPPTTPATAPPRRDLARGMLDAFGGYDYVVVPSGSCGGMLRHHLPRPVRRRPQPARPRRGARRQVPTNWSAFLTDVRGMERVAAAYPGTVTYHDSCAGLRELGVKAQPRRLLAPSPGLTLARWPSRKSAAASAARSA